MNVALPGCYEAFKTLKQVCMTTPVLAFADYTKPFLLETDASKNGFGGSAVAETGRWVDHPVTYGS